MSSAGWLPALVIVGLIWIIFVIPAERRHQKRRLDLIQKRLRDKGKARDENTDN